ncbi:rna-directed dna polymerase from mobile element jockey-like [Willisornis vidua]|uniref:Rna-directed dna polymerase from mobile element jockey-like n=1 Tax=Willisornis vidua TaxID=1566151 RepID=A0ABQ9DTQ9_9PASS|nr:rna-directed dna polymerase from mobile element jockey-like [Willisornis vidua]
METSDKCCRQGSILGLAPFNIFVSDMDSGIECTISKFANNTKLCAVVDTLDGRDGIKKDLNSLERWAREYFIKFNKANCKVLHLDQGNSKHKYRLGREQIESLPEENDVGVLMNEKLGMAQHVHWQPRKSIVSWVTPKKVWPEG